MTKNIQTLSLKVGATNTIQQDFASIQAAVERASTKVGETLAKPFGEADRTLGMFENHLTRTLDRLGKGFASEKALADLKQMASIVDDIYRKVSAGQGEASAVNPAYVSMLGRIGTLQQGIGLGQQLAVPSISASISASMKASSPQEAATQIHGPSPASRFFSGGQHLNLAPTSSALGSQITNPYGGATTPHISAASRNWSGGVRDFNQTPIQGTQPYIDSNSLDRHARQARGANYPATFEQLLKDREEKSLESRKNLVKSSDDLAKRYETEERNVDKLANKLSKLSEEERKALSHRVRAAQESGRNVGLTARALNEVSDPWSDYNQRMRTGRGSSSHSLRYGIQNAGFAVEDFLISSQYGGPKAGLRAIANNLTAITSAATSSMNPWLAGAAITGTAIGSAALPFAVNAFTGSDERSDELTAQLASPRRSVLSGLNREIGNRTSIGSGFSAARQAYEASTNAVEKFNRQKADINRSITPEVRELAGQQEQVGWAERSMAAYSNVFGGNNSSLFRRTIGGLSHLGDMAFGAGHRRVNEDRSTEQIRRIDDAKLRLDEANKRTAELGDSEQLRQDREDAKRNLNRERQYGKEDFQMGMEHRQGMFQLQDAAAQGEITDPAHDYNTKLKDHKKRFARDKARYEKADPEKWTDLQTGYDQEIQEMEQEYQEGLPGFHRSVAKRNRDFRSRMLSTERNPIKRLEGERQLAHDELNASKYYTDEQKKELRGQIDSNFAHNKFLAESDFKSKINGFEVNPLKRLKGQQAIQRELIENDPALDAEQRKAMLAGFDKFSKRQLRDIGENAPPNRGMEVGSIEDATNRYKYFNRNNTLSDWQAGGAGSGGNTESILRQILDEMKRNTQETKKNKIPVKNFN